MPMFKKKPVVIEARRLPHEKEIVAFLEWYDICEWCRGHQNVDGQSGLPVIVIETLEGKMKAKAGDWIIKGVNGEFYPCKPDIFDKTHEPYEPIEGEVQ